MRNLDLQSGRVEETSGRAAVRCDSAYACGRDGFVREGVDMSGVSGFDVVPDVVSALDEFVGAYVRAWNSHDADRLLGFMHPDIIYDDSTWPQTMRGHDDVRVFPGRCLDRLPGYALRRCRRPLSARRHQGPRSGGEAPAR